MSGLSWLAPASPDCFSWVRGWVLAGREDVVALVVDVGVALARRVVSVELKIAEELTNFFLLDLLFSRVLVMLVLAAAGGGEDHVVNELVYALAVGIVEDFADYALEEGLILELRLFVELVFRSFFPFRAAVVVLDLPMFLFGLGLDKAVQIGLGRVKF